MRVGLFRAKSQDFVSYEHSKWWLYGGPVAVKVKIGVNFSEEGVWVNICFQRRFGAPGQT